MPGSCIWQDARRLVMTDPSTTPPLPLATLRKRRLLSQRALARQAGVALSTIYLLEAGRTEHVTFKVMRAVSQALQVPAEAIVEFRRSLDVADDALGSSGGS
jgi:transcriptional regulator with XRE-family HTH domain